MPSSIDLTNLEFAVLPNALENGDNPSAFDTGTFPVKRGSAAVTATLTNMSGVGGYSAGEITFASASSTSIVTDHDLIVSNSSKFTWLAWVYINDITAGSQDICRAAVNQYANAHFAVEQNTGKLFLLLDYLGNNEAISTDAISSGAYYLVGAVKDGATLKLYINGYEVSAYDTQDSYSAGTMDLSAADFELGERYSAYFDGKMSAFLSFNDAISDARILSIYNAGRELTDYPGTDNGDNTMSFVPDLSGITLTPSSGTSAGGTSVSLTGGKGLLASGGAATLGGSAVTVDTHDNTTATITTPAGAAGAADLVWTNSDSEADTATGAFTYTATSIDNLRKRQTLRWGGSHMLFSRRRLRKG